MKLKKNLRERKIQELALERGWEVLTKGWPDFLLYKEATNEAIFVEVKRKCKTEGKTGVSKVQKRMHRVLKNIGLIIKVVYVK